MTTRWLSWWIRCLLVIPIVTHGGDAAVQAFCSSSSSRSVAAQHRSSQAITTQGMTAAVHPASNTHHTTYGSALHLRFDDNTDDAAAAADAVEGRIVVQVEEEEPQQQQQPPPPHSTAFQAPLLQGAVRLGSRQPTSIVALFPGVGGSAQTIAGLGQGWVEQNPDTQVIVFDVDAFSGARAVSAAWKVVSTCLVTTNNNKDNGTNMKRTSTVDTTLSSPAVDGYNYDTTTNSPTANKIFDTTRSRSNSFFGDILLTCCNDVSLALQEVLDTTGLTDEQLILAGFSQGASIAAYTGFLRNVAAVILMGGPGAPQRQLLPPPETTTTQVCIISGDSDPFAPFEALVTAFQPYTGKGGGGGGQQFVTIIPDLSHQIVQEHVDLGGAFIATVLNDTRYDEDNT